MEPLQATLQAKVKADAGGWPCCCQPAHVPAEPGAGAHQSACQGLPSQQLGLRHPYDPACPRSLSPTLLCAVKQEIDRNEDMLRSCLRAVDALAKMPNAQQVRGAGAGTVGLWMDGMRPSCMPVPWL